MCEGRHAHGAECGVGRGHHAERKLNVFQPKRGRGGRDILYGFIIPMCVRLSVHLGGSPAMALLTD